MLTLIYSDIHSNIIAYRELYDIIAKFKPDKLFCLGDLVGYGSNPNEVISLTKDLNPFLISGNHDRGVFDDSRIDYFNPNAREAIIWTREKLSPENKKFLMSIPITITNEDSCFVHGSLYEPENFHYLDSFKAAVDNFNLMDNYRFCFLGHTHIPGIFVKKGHKVERIMDFNVQINPKYKYIINVGSVGQPRDRHPQGSYCLWDSEKKSIKITRFSYNNQKACDDIIKAGLPSLLGNRLLLGW